MLQASKKGHPSDWWWKMKVKQTNKFVETISWYKFLMLFLFFAEAGLSYINRVKSEGPFVLSTSANCITQWCGCVWTNLFLEHLFFLGLLCWFEQILFCVCLLIKPVRIRAFIFSAMLALGQALKLCGFWHSGERNVLILTVVVCLEFSCYDPSNYLNSTDLGMKWCSFFRTIQIKDCGKCEISLLATQKLCHKKTTEISVWNNYSGASVLVWSHGAYPPHCDTNQWRDWVWLRVTEENTKYTQTP